MSLAKLGHVELETTDVPALRTFYEDLIGLEVVEQTADSVYFRGRLEREHHSLKITRSSENALRHIGWRVESSEIVDRVSRRLREEGYEVSRIEEAAEAGIGEAIRVRVPTGPVFELYYDVETPELAEPPRLKNEFSRGSGVRPSRIDHVNVRVADVERAQGFLEDLLGFRTHELRLRDGSASAFMSVTPKDHDIALSGSSPTGVHHLGYAVDRVDNLLTMADKCFEQGYPIDGGPGKHAITLSHFLHTREPETGHRVELYRGGYLALDPDWEPIQWAADEVPEVGPGGGSSLWGVTPGSDAMPPNAGEVLPYRTG